MKTDNPQQHTPTPYGYRNAGVLFGKGQELGIGTVYSVGTERGDITIHGPGLGNNPDETVRFIFNSANNHSELLEILGWVNDRIKEFGNLDMVRDEAVIERIESVFNKNQQTTLNKKKNQSTPLAGRNIYYSVEKQVEEDYATGWKIVTLYEITENIPKKVGQLEIDSNSDTSDEIQDWLSENYLEEDSEEQISLFQL